MDWLYICVTSSYYHTALKTFMIAWKNESNMLWTFNGKGYGNKLSPNLIT